MNNLKAFLSEHGEPSIEPVIYRIMVQLGIITHSELLAYVSK